jgi:phospholipid/cholesterol/gamma-HCH transport system substrate-binding protein
MKMHYSHSLSPRRISQIAGLFVVVPLLGLLVVGLFMAKSEHLFEQKYRLHTVLSQSFGLEPGAPVVISGIQIGRVETVEFTDRGTIDVTLNLRQRYQGMVREDSRVAVGKSGFLVGQTQMEIAKGSPDKPMLPDGAMIVAIEPQDFKQMLADFQPAIDSVKQALLRLDSLSQDIQATVQTGNRTLGNVEAATKDLPALVASVQNTVASVGRTVSSVERTAAGLPEMTRSVRKTLDVVDGIAGDVRGATVKLPEITGAAQDAVNNLKATTANLKGVSRQASPLVRSAQHTLEDVQTIVRGAKQTFPVSVLVANAGPPPEDRPAPRLRSLRGEPASR